MGKPFTQLYVHLVWATWDRLPLITPEIEASLFACFHSDCIDLDIETLALGGVEDHVHLLLQIPPTICISEIIKQLKGNSSHLISHDLTPQNGFKWQGYYGAFSVSRRDLPGVRDYVLCQKERHARGKLWESIEQTGFRD